ncbi:hypothetical protein [Peribacillus glennii]|uniref:Uncharacterized protein n=1 Tax=Peribacillus glennii TaxID=2303991 RepID=A0A372LKP8_9BACI|nr:hypothetical protein [Peribacillus glennii]RFU66679.1 hypothetical protein D0466_00765 [Peribacillus glennii]
MFKKISLKNKLILSFALMLLVPSILIGISSYQTARNYVETQMISNATENVEILNELLDVTIKPKMEQAVFLSGAFNQSLFIDRSYKEAHKQLKNFQASTEGLLSVYEKEQ